MGKLTHISDIINELSNISMENIYNRTQRTFIAMYRLRVGWEELFNDFCLYLRKITRFDPAISFYPELKRFLYKKYSANPWTVLNEYLNASGYDFNKMQSMRLSPEEKYLINTLPSNDKFFYILILYLYHPYTVQKFFIENFSFSLTQKARELLNIFNSLGEEHQTHILEYVRYGAKLYEKHTRSTI